MTDSDPQDQTAVSVRAFQPEDGDVLSELMFRSVRVGARRDYSEEQVQAWLPVPPGRDFMTRRAGDGRTVLVAVDAAGVVAGYGDLEADGHIDHLFVDPAHIGSGVGSRLYDAIEAEARNLGITRLYVEASEPARRLFAVKGFSLDRRNDKELRGVPIHNFSMSKTLVGTPDDAADTMNSPSRDDAVPGVLTRLVSMDDVPELAGLVDVNRAFLTPSSPLMMDEFFTLDGQAADIASALARHDAGLMLPHVITDIDGSIVGRVNLNSITRGAAQFASVGYWVAEDRNGRGIASAALAAIVEVGFGELGLHRIQGETLLDNVASQRVLEKNGFERFGLAPALLRIAGEWQDHVLFQLLNHDWQAGD